MEASLSIREAAPHEKRGYEVILRALPEWFGIEAAITAYMLSISRRCRLMWR